MTTREKTLFHALILALVTTVILIVNHAICLERENARLHAMVEESTIPPTTAHFKTRF